MAAACFLIHVAHAQGQLLGLDLGFRSALGEQGEGVLDGVVQCTGRHDLVEQADRPARFRVEGLAGEEQPPRMTQADRRDDIRGNHRRHQAELDLGQGELRRVHGDRDIAAGNQADTAAIGGAVDAADRRLGQELQGTHQGGEPERVGQVLFLAGSGHATHPLQVGARREARAFAAQYHGAHGRVVADGEQGIGQLGDQPVVEGVVHLRPVHDQLGHRPPASHGNETGHDHLVIRKNLILPRPALCLRGGNGERGRLRLLGL